MDLPILIKMYLYLLVTSCKNIILSGSFILFDQPDGITLAINNSNGLVYHQQNQTLIPSLKCYPIGNEIRNNLGIETIGTKVSIKFSQQIVDELHHYEVPYQIKNQQIIISDYVFHSLICDGFDLKDLRPFYFLNKEVLIWVFYWIPAGDLCNHKTFTGIFLSKNLNL